MMLMIGFELFFYLLVIQLIFLVPEKVQSLNSTSATSTSITLQWKKVEGTATETYSITWSSNNRTRSVSGVNKSSTIINGLISNTIYSFQIKAVNDGGEGKLSDQHNASTSK